MNPKISVLKTFFIILLIQIIYKSKDFSVNLNNVTTNFTDSLLYIFYSISFIFIFISILVYIGKFIFYKKNKTVETNFIDILCFILSFFIWNEIWLVGVYQKIQYNFTNILLEIFVNIFVLLLIIFCFYIIKSIISKLPFKQNILKFAVLISVYINLTYFWSFVLADPKFDVQNTILYAGVTLIIKFIFIDIILICILYNILKKSVFLYSINNKINNILADNSTKLSNSILILNLIFIILSAVLIYNENNNKNLDNVLKQKFNVIKPANNKIEKTNIIFVLVDTLRSDHTSLYRYNRKTTPILDKFAEQSIVFKDSISPTSFTTASVSSIFTSKFESEHGVGIGKISKLDLSFNTLAEKLQKSGFLTTAFVANPLIMKDYNYNQGFNLYYDNLLELKVYQKVLTDKNYNLLLQEFLKINIFLIKLRAENLNNKIFKWLEYNKDINEPIFMYIHYIDPHYPYIPSKKFQKFKHKTKHSINQQHIDMYDCEILYTDKQFGDLLNKLKEYNLFDNSIIIFTADHGEEFREHGGRFHSQTVYEEVVHVPCVIKFPNAEFTGKREGIFYGLDFMPTLLDYFEIPYDKNSVQGISVMNTIKNQSNSLIDREIYIENYYENKRYTIKSWRTKNWKLIINEKSPRTNIKYELYNLNNDKNEQNNVFEKYKTKAYELKKKLETKENTLNRTHESDEVKIKQSELERMKSLGYFN